MNTRAARTGPHKRSVALAVFRRRLSRPPELLAVRRPPEDEELPSVWGLPAGSLRHGESWEEAVARAGRDKLGVEVAIGPLLAEGSADREGYRLHMRLYEAEIRDGEPHVPQRAEGITQYTDWEWAAPERLADAAARGSLCARLCLEALGTSAAEPEGSP